MAQTQYTAAAATPLKLEAEITATEAVPVVGLSTYSDGAGGAVVIHTEVLDDQVVQELEQAVAAHVAETDVTNHIELIGSVTGTNPSIEAKGDDLNVGIDIRPQGSGDINVFTGTTGVINFKPSNDILDYVKIVTEDALPIIRGVSSVSTLQIDCGVGGFVQFGDNTVATTGQFMTELATGTAPLNVSSTTKCTNLNSDLLDGYHSTTFATAISPVLTTPQINNLASTFQYIITPTAIAADRIATLPLLTGDDTFVFEAHTQTLTNKTLTSPVLTTPQINDTSADHQYVFAVSELTADRNVTLPLLTGDDEFVFKGHTQTLTNKTLTSPVLTTPQINDTSADHQYVFAVSELTADRTVTLPLLTGADEFVFKDHTQTLTNKTLTSPKLGTTVCKADGTAMLNEAQLGIDEICWHIQNPRATAYYVAKYVDNYITLLECRSMTDVGTVTFNIEKRAYTTPFAAGTELLTADMVADATGEITTDFVGATDVVDGATTGQWIVLAISAIATAPTQLVVHLKYKRYGVSV